MQLHWQQISTFIRHKSLSFQNVQTKFGKPHYQHLIYVQTWYLPSKLLLHNVQTMTVINPLKNWIFLFQYTSTFSATHLRLKGNICIPCECLPRLFDDITSRSEGRPDRRLRCVCVGSAFNIIYFSPYLLIIRQFNKCGVSTLMFDHTSEAADPGSVCRTASRFPLLVLPPHLFISPFIFPLGVHIFIASLLNIHRLCTKPALSIKLWPNIHQTSRVSPTIKSSVFFVWFLYLYKDIEMWGCVSDTFC